MSSQEKLSLIQRRIRFIKELTDLKEQFRGQEKVIKTEKDWTHSYQHYDSVRIYLALTCFDILGQPDDWKDFNSWLISKKAKKERNIIFEKYKDYNYEESIIYIHQEYLKIYSVKNSFYRFIREIISIEDRDKLFKSVKCQKRITEHKINEDGTQIIATGIEYELNNEEKEKFIFELRNTFTHKGIPIASGVNGIIDEELIIDNERIWPYRGIYQKTIKNDKLTLQVKRWPYVLIEIIENTIANTS